MEEKKAPVFSPETEEIYERETENSINIPDGFKEKIMVKVANEKTKKQNIIRATIIAFALVVAVALIFLMTSCGKTEEPAEDGEQTTDTVVESGDATDTTDTTAPEVDEHAGDKGEAIIPNAEKLASTEISNEIAMDKGVKAYKTLSSYTFVLHEGHALNWYEFYNGCIDGNVGSDKAAILDHATDAVELFTGCGLDAEAAQAQAIVDALGGAN